MFNSPVLLLITTRSSKRKTSGADFHAVLTEGGAERLEVAI